MSFYLSIRKVLYIFLFLSVSSTVLSQREELKRLDKLSGRAFNNKKYDSSFATAGELYIEAQKAKSDYFMVTALFRKASVLTELNKEKEASDLLYEALKLCKDTTEDFLKASIYNELGILTFHRNNPAIAKSYYREEIKIRRQMKDDYRVANCLLNLSTMHRRLGETDSSALLLSQVRVLAQKINHPELNAYYTQGQGAQWQTLNNLDSAEVYYLKALSYWKPLNNKKDEMIPLFNLGLIYHLKNDFKKALENYLKVEKITEEYDLESYRLTLYGNLAEVYYDLKDFKRSAEYFRKHIETGNAKQKKEINEYTAKLDRQFKIEKNEIVQKQKEEIARQTLKIEEQNRRIYLSLMAIVLVAGILIVWFFYYNFKKRLDVKIEEAKKKFFSNVVHEIRTPLSMIQAPLNLLKTKITSPDDLQNIDLAERNIKRLNELVNQMLDISKIDSTKYKLNETFGDLEIFFDQLVNTYKKIAVEKNINILHNFSIGNKVVFFDKDALEKITGNLLGNAVKYSPNHSQVGIDVFTEETEQGVKLAISVWDTGVGISQKDQENIFNRFYRSEKTATSTKGVGIGLSLVKELVELQNGTIKVKSKEGNGSTFTVSLILKGKEEPVITKTVNETIANEDLDQILIVEDDKDILEFNTTYLEQNKFKVLKAKNGKEAIELLEKTLPDLIISDMMMPELDGIGLLKAVKNNTQSNHIPVIILSAKASPEARLEALKLGAQGYLAKPFLPEELLSVVSNQLEILSKRKTEFKELIAQPEKKVEEKFIGTEPYTQKLFALIFKQIEDPELSVEKLADQMATNRSHFQRKVKTITGLSPSEIIKTIRLEKANELLLNKNGNITEVAYQTGFSSQSYFTKCYTQHFGISPTQMLQKGK